MRTFIHNFLESIVKMPKIGGLLFNISAYMDLTHEFNFINYFSAIDSKDFFELFTK